MAYSDSFRACFVVAALTCSTGCFDGCSPLVWEDEDEDEPDPNGQCPEDGDNSGLPVDLTFDPVVLSPVEDVNPKRGVAGDFDDDGFVDISIGQGGLGHEVAILRGDGLGAFGDGWRLPGADCAAGDLDGDGIDDLVVGHDRAGLEEPLLSVHFGGEGFPDERLDITPSAPLGQVHDLALADFDGDGSLDLAAFAGASLIIAFNEGGRSLSDVVAIGDSDELAELLVGNLDDDPASEIVTTYPGSARYDIDESRGIVASYIDVGSTGRLVALANIDGYNHDDLVLAAGGGIRILADGRKYQDQGLFCVSSSEDVTQAGRVVVANLDGLQQLDLVTSTSDNHLAVLGNGKLNPLLLPSDAPGDVIVVDVDADGKLDIVVAGDKDGPDGQIEVHLRAGD
jgi:hypothetical protein